MKEEIKKIVLGSLKEFNIIAYGNDETIANKVVTTIKNELITELENAISEVNSNSHVASGYIDGLNKSISIINNLL